MRKRYIVSGILGLSVFAYSGDLVSEVDGSREQSVATFSEPLEKPQEKLTQEAASSKTQQIRRVKKKIINRSSEASASLPQASKEEIAIAEQSGESASSESVVTSGQRVRQPPVAPRAPEKQMPIAAPEKAVPQADRSNSQAAAPSNVMTPQVQKEKMPIAAPEKAVPKADRSNSQAAAPATVVAPQVQEKQKQVNASVKRSAQRKKVSSHKGSSQPASVDQQKAQRASHEQGSAKIVKKESPLTQDKKVVLAENRVVQGNKPVHSSAVPAQAQVIATPTAPIVKNNYNIFYGLEYLIMTSSEGGLSYARENTLGLNQCYNVDFDWNSGFRLGMGYNMGHDRWDLQMVWTWLLNRGHDSKSDLSDGLYSAIPPATLVNIDAVSGLSEADGVLADNLSSHILLHLNLLDAKIGREFFVSKWLKLHPTAGFKVGWINQDWHTTATAIQAAVGLDDVTKYTIHLKQKFWGIGPMVGLDSDWGFISNFSMYANGSVALLTGFFDNYRNEIAMFSDLPELASPYVRKSHQPQWISELQLGLRWNQWISKERYRLVFQAGWNAIFLNDQNHFFSPSGGIEANGDLMTQGVSMGMRFDF